MSRVNVNAWATDIGKSSRDDLKIQGPVIKDVMANVLKDRAKSASLILGRRHVDASTPDAFSSEVVKGVKLYRMLNKTENLLTNENTRSDVRGKRPFQDERNTPESSTGKPISTTPRCSLKRSNISKEAKVFAENSLKITSVSKQSTSERNMRVTIQTDDNVKIGTEQREPMASVHRAKSAPPFTFAPLYESSRNSRLQFHLPLFWKTRNSYHRKQSMKLTENDVEVSSNQGAKLRSLLQTSGEKACHAKCPYNCQSCFRACLASDSFIKDQLDRANKNHNSIQP